MNNFPNFHKRNKGQVSFPKFHKKDTTEENSNNEESIQYPFNSIPHTDGRVSYNNFINYIELFEKGFYKEVINLLLPKEGGGAGLTTILTMTLGPAGYFAGSGIANERNRFINFILANCYFKLEDYEKALKHLNKTGSWWSWSRVDFLRAWTLYKLGRIEESKEYFRKAFISNPQLMNFACPLKITL